MVRDDIHKKHPNAVGLELYGFIFHTTRRGTRAYKDSGVIKFRITSQKYSDYGGYHNYKVMLLSQPKESFSKKETIEYIPWDVFYTEAEAIEAYNKTIRKVMTHPKCTVQEINLLKKLLTDNLEPIEEARLWYEGLDSRGKEYIRLLTQQGG